MDDWTKESLESLRNANFCRVEMTELRAELQKRGQNREYWYAHISPRAAADRLFEQTGGDYSRGWHAHCACCFEKIGPDYGTAPAYYAEAEAEWLCSECYETLCSFLSQKNL